MRSLFVVLGDPGIEAGLPLQHLQDAPPAWYGITVRHLLSHSAGLVRDADDFDPLTAAERRADPRQRVPAAAPIKAGREGLVPRPLAGVRAAVAA